jgi:mRNA-degrading endonuclease RelE of RelBE toxin-antitoxin system
MEPIVKIIQSERIEKDLKYLGRRYRSVKKDIQPLIDRLQAGEIVGDKIVGNKYPVFKVRIKNSDVQKGKSGGYRVVYYTVMSEVILLTTIYSKSDRADISNQEIEEIIDKEMERTGQSISQQDLPAVESSDDISPIDESNNGL